LPFLMTCVHPTNPTAKRGAGTADPSWDLCSPNEHPYKTLEQELLPLLADPRSPTNPTTKRWSRNCLPFLMTCVHPTNHTTKRWSRNCFPFLRTCVNTRFLVLLVGAGSASPS
jgi:hypothetical protein